MGTMMINKTIRYEYIKILNNLSAKAPSLFQLLKNQTSLIISSVSLGLKEQSMVSTISNPKGAKLH